MTRWKMTVINDAWLLLQMTATWSSLAVDALCFYSTSSYTSAVRGISCRNSVCPSVLPSVYLSHACFVTKPNNALRIFWYHTIGQSFQFSNTNSGWWASSEICAQSNPLPSKKTPTSTGYNVSKVRDREKNLIMTNRKSTAGFPTSYWWSACVAHKAPKSGSKTIFSFKKIKFNFNRINRINSVANFFVSKLPAA